MSQERASAERWAGGGSVVTVMLTSVRSGVLGVVRTEKSATAPSLSPSSSCQSLTPPPQLPMLRNMMPCTEGGSSTSLPSAIT